MQLEFPTKPCSKTCPTLCSPAFHAIGNVKKLLKRSFVFGRNEWSCTNELEYSVPRETHLNCECMRTFRVDDLLISTQEEDAKKRNV
jgi:hypothetical protein